MQVTKALLVKFIENRCSRQEAEMVYAYLMNHPLALEELLSEADWETYDSNGVIDAVRSESWLAGIQKQKFTGKVITLKKILRIAAAAMVLCVAAWYTWKVVKPLPGKRTLAAAAAKQEKRTAAIPPKRFVNNSGEPVTYTLTDGSQITLYANSILECPQPFEDNKRNLLLHGEALFRVAKDKARPFTVFTDDFSTTALGTVFTIHAYYHQAQSSIKLLSGKVVVKNLKTTAAPVYMKPGEECVFTTGNQSLQLQVAKTPGGIINKPVTHYEKAVTETEDAIVFSNAPLQQVFNNISSIYRVAIKVEGKQLENRKFTGTLIKTDAPDELLSTIAGLNNLQLLKEGNDYLLKNKE